MRRQFLITFKGWPQRGAPWGIWSPVKEWPWLTLLPPCRLYTHL